MAAKDDQTIRPYIWVYANNRYGIADWLVPALDYRPHASPGKHDPCDYRVSLAGHARPELHVSRQASWLMICTHWQAYSLRHESISTKPSCPPAMLCNNLSPSCSLHIRICGHVFNRIPVVVLQGVEWIVGEPQVKLRFLVCECSRHVVLDVSIVHLFQPF